MNWLGRFLERWFGGYFGRTAEEQQPGVYGRPSPSWPMAWVREQWEKRPRRKKRKARVESPEAALAARILQEDAELACFGMPLDLGGEGQGV